jgi:hypothetical protein
MGNMQERQVIINFSGILTFSDISELLNELQELMGGLSDRLVIYKKIIILMVEVLENIKKYQEAQIDDKELLKEYPSVFTLSRVDDVFYIEGKNLVKNIHKQKIIDKIEHVNKLDAAELRVLYRQVISNGQFSMEGGAGLGFIELAKTSENRINYVFDPVNSEFSYYTLLLQLNG